MKLHVRFSVVLCVLIFASFANLARSQTILTTTWMPTSGTEDWEITGNWSDGVPDISNYYDLGLDGYQYQYAIIDKNSTARVTTNATVDQLYVGQNGSLSAGLSIQSGGVLTAHSLSIGSHSSSTGQVTVTGLGSMFTKFGGSADYLYVGDAGTGSLTISNGASINVGATIRVARQSGSTGTLLVTGYDSGTPTPSKVEGNIGTGAGTASITITNTAIVTGQINGSNNPAGGTLSLTLSNHAVVSGGFGGGHSTNTLTITDNASLSGGINSDEHSSTTVTVSNAATVSGGIDLHGDGTSSFTINTGATLNGSIALYSSNSATATIDGGSHSLSTGLWASGTGTNTLTVQGGAVLDGSGNTDDSIIGETSGEGGSITLTGGSSWTTGGAVYVGNGGEGSLNVGGGSTVTAVSLYVGHSGSGSGQVTVSGEGSELNVASAFTVGDSGTGSLTVSDYGHVKSAGDVTIANNGSSMGAITLASNGQLSIGEGDSGHLYLNTEAGGHGSLNVGADAGSTEPLAPGTLNAASISGSANSVLVFNHNSEALFFNPVISGGVFVVHKAGTTILNGANSYSGGNYISGGTLALGSINALGTGDITLAGGTLDLNTFSQTAGTLTVSSSSYIDFSGTSALILADLAFTGLGWVEVLDFDGLDSFQIGASLTGDQLARINIGGFIAQVDGSGFLSAGSTAFAAPVPEPSTYAALAGLAALAAAISRRRKTVAVVVRC